MLDPFEPLSFIIRKNHLMSIWAAMEIQLLTYKGDKTEPNERIELLKQHYEFLNQLQLAWEATHQNNRDYVNQNLVLLDKYQKQSKRVKELEKELSTLKENFATGI